MSQAVDLPQLSLQRYFDLVKRRRWQLIPVSLLGLIIGGLVAFFIPRFFVAETILTHQQLPGGPDNAEHPFRGIVDTAKSTIPLAVGEALDEMAWPEVQVLDAFSREQYERAIEERIYVNDANAWVQKRDYAQIRVIYRDQDGPRSAAFLNKLVEVWIEKRIAEVREPAEQARDVAKDKADRAAEVYDALLSEKQRLEREYGILPNRDLSLQRQQLTVEGEAHRARDRELLQKRVRHGQLGERLAAEKLVLEGIVPRIPPGEADLTQQLANNKQALALFVRAQYFLQAAQNFREGHPQRTRNLRTHELTMQQLRMLVPQSDVDPDGKVENPDYAKQRDKVATLEIERGALAIEIAEIEAAVQKELERQERLTVGFRLYELKMSRVDEAQELRRQAQEELSEANRVLSLLQRRLPVKVERPAYVPPAPTDPNILVVAVIGCVLGLFAAIGLILALDFLQGSFKTVDDVERGLSVPVLGGISHLETEEERVVAVRSRRRVSIVAAALLLMVTIVVTLFYLVPTRLPPLVVDLLSMVLGSGS